MDENSVSLRRPKFETKGTNTLTLKGVCFAPLDSQYLDVSRGIAAESSPLHIARSQNWTVSYPPLKR